MARCSTRPAVWTYARTRTTIPGASKRRVRRVHTRSVYQRPDPTRSDPLVAALPDGLHRLDAEIRHVVEIALHFGLRLRFLVVRVLAFDLRLGLHFHLAVVADIRGLAFDLDQV